MIYDFYEILGRGIIAARTERHKEAAEYLSLAAKIEPLNVRVWLWLATVAKSIELKKNFLQKALDIDSNLLVARILLDRLNKTETVLEESNSKQEIFTCPNCGGQQIFDPDMLGLQCKSCHTVEPLILENATESHLNTTLQKGSGNWALLASQSSCNACGAKISHSATQMTAKCPFCNSDMVAIQSATPNLLSPNGIIPFQYHQDDILKILAKEWDLSEKKLAQLVDSLEVTISSIYLPFWTFDGTVQIFCALDHRISPAIYSPEERVFLKGEWPQEKTWYECKIDDLLIYAAHNVQNDLLMSIFPFDLKSVFEYRPEILTGWQAQTYQISLEDATIESHKIMRDMAFKRAEYRNLFIEPSDLLQDDILVIDRMYKLILVPVWVINRKDAGEIIQTFINGQTGKISKRKSGWFGFLK